MLKLTSLWTIFALAARQVCSAGAEQPADSQTLVPLRTHSIYAPYVDQDLQNRWFSFGGEAYVNTNKYIRLTQDRASETGWLWSRLPISVPNFQIDIEYKISGAGSHLHGDGMAIWLTNSRAEYGPVFGSKDNFEGLGIFIDTYANSRHSYSFPRIMGMIGDGKTKYDLDKDGAPNEAGACSAKIRKTDITTKIRITYIKGQGIDVKLQYKGWDEWTPCFEIKNYTMIATPYLGVTAITGAVSDAHDVITISSNSIVTSEAPASASSGRKWHKSDSGEKEGGSWTWFFVKIMLFGGVCAGGFEAYKVFVLQKGRWSNKQF